MTNPITAFITMKDKLYDFLNKHSNLLWFLMVATYIFFLASTATKNELLIKAAMAVTLLCFWVAAFWLFETNNRDYAKARQFFINQQDSSSPEWDGYVRSFSDIEPRLQLLRNRIAQDQAEIDNIERVIKS